MWQEECRQISYFYCRSLQFWHVLEFVIIYFSCSDDISRFPQHVICRRRREKNGPAERQFCLATLKMTAIISFWRLLYEYNHAMIFTVCVSVAHRTHTHSWPPTTFLFIHLLRYGSTSGKTERICEENSLCKCIVGNGTTHNGHDLKSFLWKDHFIISKCTYNMGHIKCVCAGILSSSTSGWFGQSCWCYLAGRWRRKMKTASGYSTSIRPNSPAAPQSGMCCCPQNRLDWMITKSRAIWTVI